jgi:hypothetical protein
LTITDKCSPAPSRQIAISSSWSRNHNNDDCAESVQSSRLSLAFIKPKGRSMALPKRDQRGGWKDYAARCFAAF